MSNTPKPTPTPEQPTKDEESMLWLLKPAGYKPGDVPPKPVQDNTPAPILPSTT